MAYRRIVAPHACKMMLITHGPGVCCDYKLRRRAYTRIILESGGAPHVLAVCDFVTKVLRKFNDTYHIIYITYTVPGISDIESITDKGHH